MSTPVQDRPTTGLRDRVRRHPLAVGVLALVGVVLLGVALWLFQPWALFVDVTVDEGFPAVTAPAAVVDDATPGEEDGDADAETSGVPAGVWVDPEPGDEGAAAGDVAVDDAEVTAPAGPVALLTGEFVSRDHVTSGTATVYRLDDGSLTLRIEDLATDNGPDLFVYLDDDAADAPEGDFDDGIVLDRLKGNQGNQNYPIPADVDLAEVASVVIWCDRFSSAFGAVDLVPVG